MEFLQKIGKRYYFRQRVPLDLRRYFPAPEIKRSLRTGRYKSALSLVRDVIAKTERLFIAMRSGVLTDEMIKRMVAEYLQSGLDATERMRLQDFGDANNMPEEDFLRDSANNLANMTGTSEGIEIVSKAFSIVAGACQKDLATGKTQNIPWNEDAADLLLRNAGIVVDRNSPQYKKLCRELLKADVRQHKIEAERTQGEYDSEIERTALSSLPSNNLATTVDVNADPEKAKLLSEIVELYLDEQRVGGKQNEDTAKRYRQHYRLWYELIGDREVNSYKHSELLEARNKLIKLPANRNTSARYRKYTIGELLQMNIERPMDKRTANVYIGRIASVFAYAKRHQFMDNKIGECLLFYISKEEKLMRKRKPFTNEDLALIFDKLPYDRDKAYLAWLPLIALYTGARQGEICQLQVYDSTFALADLALTD